MEHFNKLTPAEAERLAWLAEECSEVIKAISKIQRHGYESFDPTDPNHMGNRHDLAREMIDVIKAMQFMLINGDFFPNLEKDIEERLLKGFDRSAYMKYNHHQVRT